MNARLSISAKILMLSFLNLLFLALVFLFFIRIQYRLDLSSLLLSPGRDRILAISRGLALQLPDAERADWDRLLASYTATTGASVYLFDVEGKQEAGPSVILPPAVMDAIQHEQDQHMAPPDRDSGEGPWRPQEDNGAPRPGGPGPDHPGGDWRRSDRHRHPPPPAFPVFMVRTATPTRYWVGVHVPVFDRTRMMPDETTLVWMFPSLWTNAFFFDNRPWLVAVLVVILVSGACWLPLIRSLTRSISQLTAATGAIAEGKLDTRLSLHRRDELGQLSESINRMAERLAGYVYGQRRFLSDVAHELCSPIARIQVSLGILDQRAQDNQKPYVEGVQEEVEHMSGLVNELLLFSRAQLNTSPAPLSPVRVAEAVQRVLEREAGEKVNIQTDVDEQLEVLANPEYLSRSLANVVRNAIRYAGDAGPITLVARAKDGYATITVSDLGPGIPEPELEAVFKPFYRPELARQRETGGVGLGLAIVRTCTEACGGTVVCRNRSPHGLEVEMRFQVLSAQAKS
jgi:two-component system sensor histidine kinase CpxA